MTLPVTGSQPGNTGYMLASFREFSNDTSREPRLILLRQHNKPHYSPRTRHTRDSGEQCHVAPSWTSQPPSTQYRRPKRRARRRFAPRQNCCWRPSRPLQRRRRRLRPLSGLRAHQGGCIQRRGALQDHHMQCEFSSKQNTPNKIYDIRQNS